MIEDSSLPEETAEREDPDAPTSEEKELVIDDKSNSEADFERLDSLDREMPDYFEERPSRSQGGLQEEGDRKLDAMANVAERRGSLQQFLERQICELDLDPEIERLALRIITALDPNGYLPNSLRDLLPPNSTEEVLAQAEKALRVVQELEPIGIGARDLRECLLLQLHEDMPYYEELRKLISDHLADMGENRLPLVQKRRGTVLSGSMKRGRSCGILIPNPARRSIKPLRRPSHRMCS